MTATLPQGFARVPYTLEQLAAAVEVRTHYGWVTILSVAQHHVTVVGDFGDYRIPVTTILEVR